MVAWTDILIPAAITIGILAVVFAIVLIIRKIRSQAENHTLAENIGPGSGSATRGILQATYTPRKPDPQKNPSVVARGLEKAIFVARLNPSREELDELTRQYRQELAQTEAAKRQESLGAGELISTALSPTGQIDALRNAGRFSALRADILAALANDLLNLRQGILDTVTAAHENIFRPEILARQTDSVETDPTPLSAAPMGNMKARIAWAIENNLERQTALQVAALSERLSLELENIDPAHFKPLATRQIGFLRNTVDSFQASMDTEPVGYLHLERLSFAPAGIERGELVYSVPLSPGEEVNITHKEWSNTSEEFERIVTDYKEDFSEEGVTEKSELAQSVNSQTQHSTAFNTGVTASGGYGPVQITATVGYSASSSSSKSEQLSRNQSAEITSKASSRSKQEHKVSFKLASAAGTEDQTVRHIKNPYADRATRVDYYQLLRKWQISLYRYGIRLTWDLVLPEPGSGLLKLLQELKQIRAALEIGFEFPIDITGWPGFSITPKDLEPYPKEAVGIQTEKDYREWAAIYGVILLESDLPKAEEISISITPFIKKYPGGGTVELDTIEFEVPDDYEIKGTNLFYNSVGGYGEGGWHIHIIDGTGSSSGKASVVYYSGDPEDPNTLPTQYEQPSWIGKTGTVWLIVRALKMKDCEVGGTVEIKIRQAAKEAWQQKLWNKIHDAAQQTFAERRQSLKERLTRLEEDLGAQDALSLRKKEREEVMKVVLETLGLSPTQYREDKRAIKFIHQAIEWENMLYFLYPYFWCDQKDWEFKKYLDHPDMMHRAFLKAGAARAVLTIRPGFEAAFMAFIHTGDMDQLPPSPYLEIGEEFKAYARTNYPGIPPANPEEHVRPLLTLKQKQAWQEMQLIMKRLDDFYKTNQRYPSSAEGFVALGQGIPVQDPWGNAYVYNCPGSYGDYDLASYGADKAAGGEGENADITSWAEASLIGMWYEYTPTSALDIAFDQEMPTA